MPGIESGPYCMPSRCCNRSLQVYLTTQFENDWCGTTRIAGLGALTPSVPFALHRRFSQIKHGWDCSLRTFSDDDKSQPKHIYLVVYSSGATLR